MKICDFGEAKRFEQSALIELAQFFMVSAQQDHSQSIAQKNSLRSKRDVNVKTSQGPNMEVASNENSEASFFSKMFSHSEKFSQSKKNIENL